MDVAFIGSTAYALVSVVGATFPADLFACHPGLSGSTASTGRRARPMVADIGTWSCREPAAAEHRVRRSDGSAVRARDVPRRLPRHRRSPQPRPARDARRHGDPDDAVRRHRPDRARGVGATRSTWPRPGPSRTCRRTARSCRSSRARRADASGARRPAARRRGARAGRQLFALAQGVLPCGSDPSCAGSPAIPDTGSLVRVERTTGRSRRSPTSWTGRRRSRSSGTPRTWSRSAGRSGRSTTSRVLPTGNRRESAEASAGRKQVEAGRLRTLSTGRARRPS